MERRTDDAVVETQVGDGRGVFSPATDTAVVMNPSAARIWDLAREHLSVELITQQIAAECNTDPVVIAPHVARAVAELVDRGLLDAPA